MINQDDQLKLQAFLDGELSVPDAAEVQAWLARDSEAQLLLAELQNTAKALTGNESALKLPESREFFWSKIQREIQREERPVVIAQTPSPGWLAWVRQQLVPLTGAAFLALLLGIFVLHTGAGTAQSGEMELASEDMGAYTFRDQVQKMTMVWFYDREEDSQFTEPSPLASVEAQ